MRRASSLADETPKGKQTLMAVRPTLSPHRSPPAIPTPVAIVAPASAVERLVSLLESGDLSVVVRAHSPDTLGRIDADPAAVVLVTSDLEGELEPLARSLRARLPHTRLVVVAPSASPRALRSLFTERVDALVLEEDVDGCLALAVRGVCAGQISFPQSLRGTLARPALSAREKQVLGMVVLGLTNREIAHKLRLSESTIKSHLATSYTKLGVRTRAEAAAFILDPRAGLGTGILTITDE
jgi:DNA-binding NarL/FixJ family response regulator